MFKVLNRTPPIPETLSSEGKDFLHCCFRRNPAERSTAMKLLEHPFVRNSYDQNVAVSMQSFSAIYLTVSMKYWSLVFGHNDCSVITFPPPLPKEKERTKYIICLLKCCLLCCVCSSRRNHIL